MENKDQGNVVPPVGVGGVHTPPPYNGVSEIPSTGALSLEEPGSSQPLIVEQSLKRGKTRLLFAAHGKLMAMVILLIILAAAVLGTLLWDRASDQKKQLPSANRFTSVTLPLGELLTGKDLGIAGTSNVTINGTLQVKGGLLLAPSLQPTGAKPGQIYYDQGTQQLAYYNGSNFVFLNEARNGSVQSLGGATGQLVLGAGLTMADNQLTNTGVLSVQGSTGNVTFTAGPGLVINGTNFSNSGVLSVAAGTPNVTVQNVDGAVTISVASPIAGTGTVASSGGTSGTIPVFTASQNIEDSIITQAGLGVSIGGDLQVTGNVTLSNALTVGQGGSGATSLTANGVLVGNGTSPISSVAAGGAGLCLLSTAGAPTWGVCPGGGGVTTLNGLAGALTIANSSGAGSTITIDDATTSSKGIASFNGTNFSVTGGAVNTVQNIDATASPTFSGVNTNAINPSSALTVGAAGQVLLLQGNASTQLRANNGASSTTVSFQSPTANVTYRFLTASAGAYDICTTAGNCVGTGGGVTTTGGTANRVAKFSAGQAINDSTITDDGTNVLTSVDMVIQGGDLTIGVPTTQTGTINLANNGSGFLGSIIQGALSGNRTYTLPDASGTICLSSGNCAAGGVTSLNGLVGALNIANASAAGSTITIDDASTTTKGIASFNSTNFSVSGGVANTIQNINTTASPTFTAINTNTITPSGALSVGVAGQTATLTGSITTISSNGAGNNIVLNSANTIELQGTSNVTGNADISGTLAAGTGNAFQVAANGNITTSGTALVSGASLTIGGSAQAGSLILNDGSANTATLNTAALGQDTVYVLPDPGTGTVSICLTSGNCAGTGGGVTTAGGTTNRLAKFSGSQAIADSTISDNGTNVTTSVDLIIQGGEVTVGVANSQVGTINLAHSGSAFLGSILQGALTANRTYTLPDASGTICLSSGNCSGSGSSNTLQAAYDAGNTITSTSGRDVSITMADSATDSNFLVDLQCDTGCGSNGRFAIQDDGTDVFTVLPAGGATLFRNSTNSTTAFRVQNALGTVNVFTLDTTNILTRISGAGTDASLTSGTGAVQIGSDNAGNIAIDDNEIIARNNGSTSTLFLQNGGGGLNVGADLVVFQNAANGSNVFNVNNASGVPVVVVDTADGELELGASTALTGTLLFRNATNTFVTTLSPTAPTAHRNINLPDASGTVCLQSSSACGFLTGTAADYIQNQNSVSQTANWRISGTGRADIALQAPLFDTASAGALAIGTTNANAINLQQNTTLASGRTLTVQGNTLIQPATNGTSAFNIRTATANNVFTVDTTNTRVGIGLGASVTPTLAHEGLEIKGALRLSGAGGSYDDTYITPNGGTVSTMINVVNYDPGASAQIVAMGLPSTANATARVISLFDARSGSHQPTLAVLSPDQNQIGGFSWDGSNATFLTKTSSNNMALQANGLNVLTLQNVSGSARLGVGVGNPGYALDVNGDANISSGSAYKINGTNICTSSGCTPAAGSGNYIQNTTTVQTGASIAIQSAADANVTALLKQRTTQSADILRVVDASDGLIFNIDTFGNSHLVGNMTIDEYLGVGVANDSGIALNVSSDLTNSQIGLKVSSVTSGQTADVAQFFGPSSRSMTYGANGTLTVKAGSSQTASLFEIQSAAGGVFGSLTAGGQLTLGRIAGSGTVGAGSLVLADGTTSNFGATLNTTTLTASRTITLPDASGTVCLQGSTGCSFAAATCVLTGTYICNGGNTPVSSVTIGTTNAQPLNFMTNSGTRASISSTGIFQVFGNGTGSARVGGDCGSNYTAINLGGTTAFDCTNYNFLSGPTDTSLYINRPSGSSIFVREGNSSTNHLSIAGGGAFTAQNTTDTSAGFRVLNAGSVPLFQIDTSTSRVYIGNPVADTTGALLVLDTKTSAGDPTGVDGGMYYNSALGKMRCYENGNWQDCMDSARTGFHYTADLFTTAGDTIVGISSGGTGSSNNNIASIAGHQGIIRLNTGTTTGGWGNVGSNDAGQAYYFGSESWVYETVLRVNTLSDGTDTFAVRAGFGDAVLTDGNNGCFLRYSHNAQSGNWQGMCMKASVATTCNTAIPVVAGTWYRLTVSVNAAATSVTFRVNGAVGCTISTGIPSGAGQEVSWNTAIAKSAGTTARSMDVDYVEMRNQYTTSR